MPLCYLGSIVPNDGETLGDVARIVEVGSAFASLFQVVVYRYAFAVCYKYDGKIGDGGLHMEARSVIHSDVAATNNRTPSPGVKPPEYSVCEIR